MAVSNSAESCTTATVMATATMGHVGITVVEKKKMAKVILSKRFVDQIQGNRETALLNVSPYLAMLWRLLHFEDY